MKKIRTPFFVVNPKSYLYGEESLQLALAADKLAEEYDVDIFFTAPFADLANIKSHTKNLKITAQHMDPLVPGRGMGFVLPESLKAVGVDAVFLNHAEHSLKLTDLVKAIKRAKELGIITIVCADSIEEAVAIAMLGPDILLCEPTDLIGTGKTSSFDYINETTSKIKEINKDILVMQAAGISSGEDVYQTIMHGADGTGATSGIINAPNRAKRLEEMIQAIVKAKNEK
ncbi:triose-phosphate isomerase [Thermoanaerobacterium thermosaccharolyticum]|uniref:Triose-phosphate isomerase n=1 Tax=Thermoanaerobacterium thermosaccharolyticum TaxID=1517 RepID=A0A231VCR5_THETR|nr:triose-phosphate isomerase [Thermoanaerobacterium thermosaccharolyticum]OXT05975.1 triose-phosphate isomerase [Thermoanaerobacterium thermosaccharolyticum]